MILSKGSWVITAAFFCAYTCADSIIALISRRSLECIDWLHDLESPHEVAVIDSGTRQKRDCTGSIAQVKGFKIDSPPVQPIEQGRQDGNYHSNYEPGNAPIIAIPKVKPISSGLKLRTIRGIDDLSIEGQAFRTAQHRDSYTNGA